MKICSRTLVFVRLFAALCTATLSISAFAQGPNLLSAAAVVIDARTGETIFAKNANMVTPIASITKLMTAMVVLDAQQSLEDTLPVDIEDLDYLKASRSRLAIGTNLTRRDMLRLALMSSENRAASSLGRHFPGGFNAAIRAMNAKAAQLGMGNTRFVDNSGLSPENVSTAHDLVLMVKAASAYPLIREFSTQPEHYVQNASTGQTLHYNNSNSLVRSPTWDISLQKTGFINEAGRCVVMMTNIGQRPVVMVLLDSQGRYSRQGDAERMRTWMETGEVVDLPAPAIVHTRMAVVHEPSTKRVKGRHGRIMTVSVRHPHSAKSNRRAPGVRAVVHHRPTKSRNAAAPVKKKRRH